MSDSDDRSQSSEDDDFDDDGGGSVRPYLYEPMPMADAAVLPAASNGAASLSSVNASDLSSW